MSNEYKPTYVDNTDNSISIMESTDTISFCKTGTKINTLSAKNVAHKKTGEDLNLCAYDGSSFNPVLTINNQHNDCRIMTNLNVSGNINVSNNINGNISGRLYGDIYLKDGSGYIFQAGDSIDPVSRLYNTRLYNSNGQAILTVQAGSEHFNGNVSGDVTGQLNGSVYKSNGTDYVLKVDTGSAVSHLYNTRLYNSNGQAILTVQAGSEHFNGNVSSSTISVKTLEAKSGENGILTINSNTNINKNLNVLQNINCIDTITSNINLVSHNLIIPTHNNSNLLSNMQGSIYFNKTQNMYEGYVGDNEGQGWQPLGGFSKTKDAVIHKNLNVNGNINCTNDIIIHKNLNVNGNVNLNNDTIIGNGTINTSLGEISRGAVPIKAIIMWSGTEAEAQALVGWALCIGGPDQNGIKIPDLRDRFIVGAGSMYPIYDTGGEATVTLSPEQMPRHKHDITVENDSHTHGTSVSGGSHNHALLGSQSSSVTFENGSDAYDFAVKYANDSISGGDHTTPSPSTTPNTVTPLRRVRQGAGLMAQQRRTIIYHHIMH